MGDKFDKVTANTPRVIPATTWNALLDAGRDYQRRKLGALDGASVEDPLNPAVRVLVKNVTGAAVPVGSVLTLGVPIIDPSLYPREASRSPIFPGTTPAATSDQFAILLDPCDINEIGRAVLMGVVSCSVNMNASTDTYCTPKAGDSTQMDSATTGPGRILWRESGSGGTKKALVQLVPAPPVTRTGRNARITTASSGLWKWVALTLDNTGAEIDDGTETATYNARPLKIDGVTLANPVAGDRVWMTDSKQSGFYEFIPIGMAASGFPGLVSKDDQTWSGSKTFEKFAFINSTNARPNSGGTLPVFTVSAGDYTNVPPGNVDYPPTIIHCYDKETFTGNRSLTAFKEAFYSTGASFPTTVKSGSLNVGGSIYTRGNSGGGFGFAAGDWPVTLVSGDMNGFWFSSTSSYFRQGVPQATAGTFGGTPVNYATYEIGFSYVASGTPPQFCRSIIFAAGSVNSYYDCVLPSGGFGQLWTHPLKIAAAGFAILPNTGLLPIDGVSGTVTAGGHTLTFTNGILTGFV